MIDERIAQLHNEVAVGEEHKQTWDRMVKPFFDQKQKDLFFSFTECSVGNSDMLMQILHQSKALESLEQQFIHFINTGEMAKITLEKE